MTNVDVFSIDLHAMPCTNHCKHCWTNGSRQHRPVPVEQVFFVLDKLAEMRKSIPQGAFFLYDEPTTHPHFIEIVERAAELGLLWESFFLPTNGSVLARAGDETWQRLKRAGADCLQLTVYGLEQTHDTFAGRRGAFQDLVTTVRRAMEHDVAWYAGVLLHADNVDELPETLAYVRHLDPAGKVQVGWYPFSWQGRGRDARRVHAAEYASCWSVSGSPGPRSSRKGEPLNRSWPIRSSPADAPSIRSAMAWGSRSIATCACFVVARATARA
jgi:MoaA/NifB/PqqE/SkfB family radical SAM enzyme